MESAKSTWRMPAEWERHSATIIAWPHQRSDWPGKFAAIAWVYTEIVRHLAASERVVILVKPGTEFRIRNVLRKASLPLDRIALVPAPTDRAWLRDSGPIGVVDGNGDVQLLDWQFNAWAKYDNWAADDKVPSAVADVLKHKIRRPERSGKRIVLEGGAIDVNGTGLMLTTEECLLSDIQCRNPGFTKIDYELAFAEHLGVAKVLWLGRGIAGDDTHGHVDDLARFVKASTIVTVVESDHQDANYSPLQENRERLQGMTDAAGNKLDIVELPMPRPVVFDGQRLPASYANFYIGNECVLVPTFNDIADRRVLGILSELFPEREVIGIHSVDLVWGFGTLHCLTQQVPAGKPV